jgi:hypothetical protein
VHREERNAIDNTEESNGLTVASVASPTANDGDTAPDRSRHPAPDADRVRVDGVCLSIAYPLIPGHPKGAALAAIKADHARPPHSALGAAKFVPSCLPPLSLWRRAITRLRDRGTATLPVASPGEAAASASLLPGFTHGPSACLKTTPGQDNEKKDREREFD